MYSSLQLPKGTFIPKAQYPSGCDADPEDRRISKAGALSPVKWLMKKKLLEVQGLAISATVAISGVRAVAGGMEGVGSTAGAATSIGGRGAAAGAWVGFGRD